jgi:hypothetical protein
MSIALLLIHFIFRAVPHISKYGQNDRPTLNRKNSLAAIYDLSVSLIKVEVAVWLSNCCQAARRTESDLVFSIKTSRRRRASLIFPWQESQLQLRCARLPFGYYHYIIMYCI